MQELDLQQIGRWIATRHCAPRQLAEYRDAFASHPLRLLVVDEFLRPEIAETLSAFLHNDVRYKRIYGRYAASEAGIGSASQPKEDLHTVTAEEWPAVPETERFYTYEVTEGATPGNALRPGLLQFLQFRTAFAGRDFREFFSASTGLSLGELMFYVHAMRNGDYLRAHSDNVVGRQLAFTLYLTPDWKAEDGGALVLEGPAGTPERIVPHYNRLVLFDVKERTRHEVEPVTSEKSRISIGGWIGTGTNNDH